ncbi:MAG: phosphoribosyl-ATP diphosphatase [Methanobrevibacter sp.]|jgi:phosphoribosyl-ATP pyrophosphohydrolase|nr:phosphoribosyl-ATP diphosphatase [Candidatus Methanovirga aequatorialis]
MTNEKIIAEIYETLKNRRDFPIKSYTSKLMKDTDKLAEDKILEKIGEEAAEVIIASKNNENLIEESVDLIFHNLILLVYKGIELEDLLNEFKKRRR